MSIQVAIVMGSASDWDVMSNASKLLDKFGIEHESRVLSAHRTPKQLEEFIVEAENNGIQVFIAGAGLAAALPGVVAAQTTIPVIGVPLIAGSLDGMDALMAIVQMPPGIPVGTVAIGKPGAINAALYAISIMALKDESLAKQLKNYRAEQAEKVLSATLGYAVPPTVRFSILMVGCPTLTGTVCPSLPQLPLPGSRARLSPIIDT